MAEKESKSIMTMEGPVLWDLPPASAYYPDQPGFQKGSDTSEKVALVL
jgi:hypothetical protein